jgi:uncharacterized protein (DUF1684 family)
MTIPSDPLSLADWRRTVAEMYAAVRQAPEAGRQIVWQDWRAARNHLFKTHPQSPLDPKQRPVFHGLSYYDYDPKWRLLASITPTKTLETFRVQLAADGDITYTRFAQAHFTIEAMTAHLTLFWIEGYGGGLFVPFRDDSNGRGTFGGGRYLFDTIKGADLGSQAGSIILDFNYAYNPSCAYHPRWVCPLSPPENKLPFSVTAGEKTFID